MEYNFNGLSNNIRGSFTSSWLNDTRFKNEPGYILCHKLRKEMDESPSHWVTLESAVEFLNFYGFQGLFDFANSNTKDGWMYLLAQASLRQLDLAMIDKDYKFALIKEEVTQ